jgi:hypothetical protein
VTQSEGPEVTAEAGSPVRRLLLMQLGAHPEEIAVTQMEACREGGAFFLDFSRPLRRERYLGIWNPWFGVTMSLRVPVVHQGENPGSRCIGVDRTDPYFRELQRLWQARFPQVRRPPLTTVDAPQVAADFVAQFPQQGRQVPENRVT